ncbi:sulfite exporter TauE/SafE family protein [bacterium]|nr:sulfite exporter TauE/SafE family protein [bacterium]
MKGYKEDKNKFIFIFLTTVAGLFFYFNAAIAHALDVSIVNFLLPKCESNDCQLPFEVKAEYILSWPEATFLVNKKTNDSITDFTKLNDYQQVFSDYFKNKTRLLSPDKCDIEVQMLTIDPETVLFDGVIFDVTFSCLEKERSFQFENELFLEYFDLQTNIIRMFIGYYDELLSELILDNKNTFATIGYNKPSSREVIELDDTFNEGAKSKNSNAQQLATATVKDMVSISVENDALDFPSEKDIKIASSEIVSTIAEKDNSNAGKPLSLSREKNNWLEKLTGRIRRDQDKNRLLTLFIVLMLGFLHTLEAGHSKTILASLLIDKKMNIQQGLGYATVFTITHIADILLLGILFLTANAFVNVYTLLPHLQTFSLYALIFIAIYLLIKNTLHYLEHKFKRHHHHHGHHHHHHEIESNTNFKHQLYIGFITGLAPCLFGWSIFMLFLSTGRMWFVIPLILAFGAGIFLALGLISLIVVKLKDSFFNKYKWIGELSPIISALLLFAFGLWQLL